MATGGDTWAAAGDEDAAKTLTDAREWIEVSVQVSESSLDAGELLGALQVAAVTGGWQDGQRIRLYWPREAWTTDMAAHVRDTLVALGCEAATSTLTVSTMPAEDWNAVWARSVKPIRIGRLVVRPPWDVPPTEPGLIDLVIEPKLAFGTGHHATTQMLVEWLSESITGGESVLDVGAGTGILAMVALRLGAIYAEAWELDPQVVDYARGYARDNGFGDELRIRQGSPSAGHGRLRAQWDLVLANLDRGGLTEMAEELGRLGQDGAVVLVSGLLTEQVVEMEPVFAQQGLYVTARRDRDGWVALRLQRAPSCEGD
ncbi:hypothetical protein YTPLAS18_11240 [Nitrospira sp.]|nr:hypothetical protein YTPLAS18_11240 [Nitrospira sp.]